MCGARQQFKPPAPIRYEQGGEEYELISAVNVWVKNGNFGTVCSNCDLEDSCNSVAQGLCGRDKVFVRVNKKGVIIEQ